MPAPNVVLFFLDGVGIGDEDPDVNPLLRADLPVLSSLLGGSIFHKNHRRVRTKQASLVPAGATLGVPGLPQSGTGQTAIFTGVNAPKLIGRHFGPFPTTALRPVIREQNIFTRLLNLGKKVAFVNAFPRQFFEYTENATRRLTVTTLACTMAGMRLRTADDLRRDEAVSADITRLRWVEMGYPDLPPIQARSAGGHLAELSQQNDFTLFEYWLTDHAGHKQDMSAAREILERFDGLLGGFLDRVNLERTTAVIISDHGNIENLTIKGHTRNPVPCIVIGSGKGRQLAKITNLTHITPAILKFLTM